MYLFSRSISLSKYSTMFMKMEENILLPDTNISCIVAKGAVSQTMTDHRFYLSIMCPL